MTNSQIRQQARELLKDLQGKWELFILPIIIPYFSVGLSFRSQFITYNIVNSPQQLLTSLNPFPQIWSFIVSLVSLSVSFTILDIYRRRKDKASFDDCFQAFSGQYLPKLFLAHLLRILLLLPWALLISLPIVAFEYLNISLSYSLLATQELYLIVGFIVFLIGTVLLINRLLTYSQVELILYDKIQAGKDFKIWGLFKESKALMKGQKLSYFLLQLSFFGWNLLVYLTLGLLNFYVIPYRMTAETLFYEKLLKQK